jgi:pimeloyl-ACP methyl ester carboxylesterase
VNVTEREFRLAAYTLAARIWGGTGGVPVLALHGWLDNAGSFDRLAPLLPGTELVALDLAGHGHSGFRSPDSGYAIWQDIGDVIDVADQLGWERFSLLGHSRGAAVAMLTAGAFPERIERLALIEGGMPFPAEEDEAPETMARAMAERHTLAARTGRVFAERSAAIVERTRGLSKISTAAAETLAQRSLREIDGGWRWHADPRLKGGSELKLTPGQIEAFVSRVRAPTMIVFAEQSPFRTWPIYRRMVPLFRHLTELTLAGGHHLHLEGAERAIAEPLREFLDLRAAQAG